tara:strand:+ start:66 stop:287 length:222 start_codon:yes stop_codon:yes gene_type:complete
MGTKKSWQDKRIDAINRKIKKGVEKGYSAQNLTECYLDEYDRIYNSQARDKEEYKAQCEHEHNDYINACGNLE